jgi:hypothetical protein
MPATTQDRQTQRRNADDFEFPVAGATDIPAGVIVAVNASGLAVNGATSATLKAAGVSQARANNAAGADSAINVKVRRGCYRFGNSASGDQIVLADIGADCYIVDNQTVAKTSNSSARSVAGKVRDVDATGVWVEF